MTFTRFDPAQLRNLNKQVKRAQIRAREVRGNVYFKDWVHRVITPTLGSLLQKLSTSSRRETNYSLVILNRRIATLQLIDRLLKVVIVRNIKVRKPVR